MTPKLVIFDLDGTLANTIEDVTDCFNAALAKNGFATYSLEEVAKLVGGDLESIVERMLPKSSRTRDNIDRVKADYRRLYAMSAKPKTIPYEGVSQLLEELNSSGIGVAVNTNKGQDLAEDCLARLFPGKCIPVVGYVDRVPPKPDPQGARHLMETFGVSPSETVYVGDGISDARTAKNAGIPFVFCSWGQGNEKDARAERPDMMVAESAEALCEILLKGDSHEC